MKTLVLANQKGGVGKSAIVCQYAFYLAQSGLRVLVLDLDHQLNATRPLARSGKVLVAGFTMSEVLAGEGGVLPDGAFVLVAGDDTLGTLERQPHRHNEFVNALRQFLDRVAHCFDACIIDTNPNPDIRYAAALIAAQYLLSPIELNQEAIDGIGALLQHQRYGYRKVRARLNPQLELIGILPNMVEATPFQRTNFAQIAAQFPQLLIPIGQGADLHPAFLPARTAIAEAQAAGVPLWQLRQAVPDAQRGVVAPHAMPVRSAAREAWHAIRPVFQEVARRMDLGVQGGP